MDDWYRFLEWLCFPIKKSVRGYFQELTDRKPEKLVEMNRIQYLQ